MKGCFSIQHYCDAVSMLLPSLLYEAQIEAAKRQQEADGFVRRYPYGLDVYGLKPPQRQVGEKERM